METKKWVEVPVFIHGITPDADPHSHASQYESLNGLILKAFERLNEVQKLDGEASKQFNADLIPVEWGWLSPGDSTTETDEWLAKAEHRLLEIVSKSEIGISNFDFTLNPMRVFRGITRALIFQGFADLFYYASREGEIVVRDHVFRQIVNGIKQIGEAERISLTLITHSAGTIIAHDLLYQLFRSEEVVKVKANFGELPHPAVKELRELTANGQLRIRRFYTLGSPITPLVMRSTGLIRKSLANEPLLARNIGLEPQPDLPGYRWVNFWDQDDFASYPVSFLYEAGVVEDRYVDVCDSILLNPAHNLYW